MVDLDDEHGERGGRELRAHSSERLLRAVPGIGFTHFTAEDVVRHPLVARIIRAYDSTARAADD